MKTSYGFRFALVWAGLISAVSTSCYNGMMGPGGRMGYGMGWLGMVFMGLFWIVVVVGIALLVVFLARSGNRPRTGEDSALGILRERYARGEIGKEEFEAKKRDLSEK